MIENQSFSQFFEPNKIQGLIDQPSSSIEEISELLQAQQFDLSMLSRLVLASDEEVQTRIVDEAVKRREKIWDNQLFLMPPLYVSNKCFDRCTYCGFAKGNVPEEQLRRLQEIEVYIETKLLLAKGYGDVELVSATDPDLLSGKGAARFVAASKRAGAKNIGINFFPLAKPSDYQELSEAGANFAIVWQETYDERRFRQVHPLGTPKANMKRRLNAHDRALQGGIPTVGLAFLGGISDWKFDVLSTIHQAQYLQKEYNANIIFGMPRWKADAEHPLNFKPTPYSDDEYKFVGALYTLAIPAALPWFSTRENFDLSAEAARGGGCLFTLDCSTSVGGYSREGYSQFPVFSRDYNEGVDWLKEEGFKPQIHLPW